MITQKLLVINQYYAPDVAATAQLAAELCSSLAERGYEVHVLTGQPSYTATASEAPPFEVLNGVHVHRVPMNAGGRERMRSRLTGYLQFLWRARRMAGKLASLEHFDGVLTFHNPPIVGIVATLLARRHGIRYTYVLYDIHPDIVIATGWIRLPRPVFWLWDVVHRWIMRRADAIIVLSENMKRTLVEGKHISPERVHVVPVWGRPELRPAPPSAELRQELGVGEKDQLLLYSGNMGVMHSLDTVLDAADLLRGQPFRFLFVGDGIKRELLVSRAQREKLDQVRFLPFQPEERFVQLVSTADLCLVCLAPGMERFALPSRTYTFMSAGRPLITVMSPDADVAQQVTEFRCGWNVTSGAEFARLVNRLAKEPQELIDSGERARAAYEMKFRRERVTEEYIKVLEGHGMR